MPDHTTPENHVTNETRLARGDELRRKVLGDEYVERSRGRATEFNAPLQELVTEYCWGAVWGRPGLELKTRSLLNLAMLTALNRPQELSLHIRGALNNGCTHEQIRETLLQAAIYCGIPAALDAFRNAADAIAEVEAEASNPSGTGRRRRSCVRAPTAR
jgi:4-carboxymuconolactone decarboxylase